MDFNTSILKIRENRIVKATLRTALQHSQITDFGPKCEKHENRQHAPSANVVTVNEAQSVGDGIPQSFDGPTTSPELSKPFRKGNFVQITDHVHPTVEIKKRTNNGRRCQSKNIVDLVLKSKLFRF